MEQATGRKRKELSSVQHASSDEAPPKKISHADLTKSNASCLSLGFITSDICCHSCLLWKQTKNGQQDVTGRATRSNKRHHCQKPWTLHGKKFLRDSLKLLCKKQKAMIDGDSPAATSISCRVTPGAAILASRRTTRITKMVSESSPSVNNAAFFSPQRDASDECMSQKSQSTIGRDTFARFDIDQPTSTYNVEKYDAQLTIKGRPYIVEGIPVTHTIVHKSVLKKYQKSQTIVNEMRKAMRKSTFSTPRGKPSKQGRWFLGLALCVCPALSHRALAMLIPCIAQWLLWYLSPTFAATLDSEKVIDISPSRDTLRSITFEMATDAVVDAGHEMANAKHVSLACDKGEKKHVDHLAKCLSWFSTRLRRVDTFVLDIDGTGCNSADLPLLGSFDSLEHGCKIDLDAFAGFLGETLFASSEEPESSDAKANVEILGSLIENGLTDGNEGNQWGEEDDSGTARSTIPPDICLETGKRVLDLLSSGKHNLWDATLSNHDLLQFREKVVIPLFIAVPSTTQYIERVVKEAALCSSTNRCERLRSALAIARSRFYHLLVKKGDETEYNSEDDSDYESESICSSDDDTIDDDTTDDDTSDSDSSDSENFDVASEDGDSDKGEDDSEDGDNHHPIPTDNRNDMPDDNEKKYIKQEDTAAKMRRLFAELNKLQMRLSAARENIEDATYTEKWKEIRNCLREKGQQHSEERRAMTVSKYVEIGLGEEAATENAHQRAKGVAYTATVQGRVMFKNVLKKNNENWILDALERELQLRSLPVPRNNAGRIAFAKAKTALKKWVAGRDKEEAKINASILVSFEPMVPENWSRIIAGGETDGLNDMIPVDEIDDGPGNLSDME